MQTPPKQKNNEWFTPSKYIEAAREVMGGIDLDPASCALANETVKATRYYTKEDDGLLQPWSGNVWCNPPWGMKHYGPNGTRSSIGVWANTLVKRYYAKDISQAILLIAAHTKGLWFYPLWDFPICFTNHCIKFNRPNQKTEDLRDSTCFVYLGPNDQRFIQIFSQFGRVVRAVDTLKIVDKPQPLQLCVSPPG